MADSFLDSFTGAAAALTGRTPDGAGSIYALDTVNSTTLNLSTMLIDGAGNLIAESDAEETYAKSTFTRLGPYYTIEVKFKIGSDSSDVVLNTYAIDAAGPTNLMEIGVLYYGSALYLSAFVWDISETLIWYTPFDLPCTVTLDTEQTLEVIVTPVYVQLKLDGVLIETSGGFAPGVSLDAISFNARETTPASPGAVLTSVRVYENQAPPATSINFNSLRPRIFAPG